MPWGLIKSTYTVPELKYKDTTAVGAASGSGSFALLNGLSLGTSAITRIGRVINMKSLHIKFEVVGAPFSQSPVAAMTTVRCMIIYDLQPNGSAPAVGDVLEVTTAGYQSVSSTALKYGSRFKILMDKRWKLNNQLASATTSYTFSELFDEQYIKMNLKTQYANSNNGDITDIDTGSLYLFITSDADSAVDNGVLLFYARLRFTDN